jgi:hypothetical protein
VNKGLKRELQGKLRVIGREVAEQAKQVAEFRRLRGEEPFDKHQGALIARIIPTVRGGSVFIRDSARTVSAKYPQGYNYPARYEYGQGGSRSFLRDGLEGKRETVIREFENLESWIADEWGRD